MRLFFKAKATDISMISVKTKQMIYLGLIIRKDKTCLEIEAELTENMLKSEKVIYCFMHLTSLAFSEIHPLATLIAVVLMSFVK